MSIDLWFGMLVGVAFVLVLAWMVAVFKAEDE